MNEIYKNTICAPEMTRYRYLIWVIAPLALFLPLVGINSVALWGNSDALFYTNILGFISEQLRAGHIFPHWFAEANGGFGSPVMFFYAPLAYTITALINLPLTPLHLSIGTQFLIGIYVSQVVSGFTAFIWLRERFEEQAALIASLLFVLLPYKLIYIYLHLNLAQLWALALLPIWMLAAERIAVGNMRAIGIYALALAGAYYCHPLTVIAFGAVPVCYALWFGKGERCIANYAALIVANGLGLGICTLYALPQQAYLGWIHPSDFITGRFFWKNNLLHVDIFLCLYYGLIAIAVTCAVWFLTPRQPHLLAVSIFWLLVLSVVAFLTLGVSAFVWERVTMLQYLQFPAARLHAVALMAAVYFFCVWLANYDKILPLGPTAYHKYMFALLIIIFAVATLIRIERVYADPHNANKDYVDLAPAAKIIPEIEYKTQWDCVDAAQAFTMYQQHQIPASVAVEKGNAKVTVDTWQPPKQMTFTIDVTSPSATFAVRQCYIPNWIAKDESGKTIPILASATFGLIEFALPQGVHKVEVTLSHPYIENLSRLCSALSLIACLALIGLGGNRRAGQNRKKLQNNI